MGRGMADNVTRLPTAPASFITIRKARCGWDVMLATPAGPKLLRTAIAWADTREAAITIGQNAAKRTERPFKAKLGGADD